MRPLYWLVLAAGLVLAYPVYSVEIARWDQHYADCRERYAQNARLLRNSLCADAFERDHHGPKAAAACELARRENRERPVVCATRAWWSEGELAALWRRVVHSRLMLWGILVPPLLLAVWLLFCWIKQPTMVAVQWNPSMHSNPIPMLEAPRRRGSAPWSPRSSYLRRRRRVEFCD